MKSLKIPKEQSEPECIYLGCHYMESITNREYRVGNQEKLATYSTQDEEKKNNTICVGHHYAQVNTNNVNMT